MLARFLAKRSPLRRAAGIVLAVALAIGATPRPVMALGHDGCTGATADAVAHHLAPAPSHHGVAASAAPHEHGRSSAAAQASSTPGDACDHCPADQCAMTAPCSGAATALPADTGKSRLAPAGREATTPCWRPAHSRTALPPTPPPLGVL